MNDFDALTRLNKITGHDQALHDEALVAWYELKFKKIVSTVISKFRFEQLLAEDIAQDVLLKAVVKIGDIKNESAVKGWLNTIVRNACIDQVRNLTIKPDEPKEAPKKASIINVREENGLKITEYSLVEPDKTGARKFKFNVQYTKVNDDGSDNQTFDELLDSFASDIDLYQESPVKDLMQKNLDDCVQKSISQLHQIDPQKAEAIRLLMLDTPKIEIAIQLNKSPKAIREYLSQCYKKIESFVKPCYELYKLAL